MTVYFVHAFIYLCAAVIAVPLAKRCGLGSVLGYLLAGVVIGPVIGLVGEETLTIQHFAEFGVVMMLFLVGLELEPRMLWEMRHRLMGLGGLQVGLTTGLIFLLAAWFGLPWQYALAIGLIFSLSSTAIVLQTFSEKGLAKTEGGRGAFSVLLFQDIAVIPMLALIPLLAVPDLIVLSQALANAAAHHESVSFVADLPGWLHALIIVISIGAVVIGGHYLSRPLFRFVAQSGLREIFTAAALMLVIGIAALMSIVELSPALGTFLAGVVLANSEFRHELESNIEPFKGLLLGLFFITVGAGIDFTMLVNNVGTVLMLTAGVIALKALVLLCLAFLFKLSGSAKWLLALSLAQAGEFGFVLLSFSAQNHVLPLELTQILSLVVALSMFLTPGLFIIYEKVILPRYEQTTNEQEADTIDDHGTVLIAGMGRFGQIVNRFLVANGVKTVVLDHDAPLIERLRKIKNIGYFGDATRPDLLHTAGIADAELLIVALDDQARTTALVQYTKHTYPNVKVMARAYDRGHGYELHFAGADFVISETYYSALNMGGQALAALGERSEHVEQLKSAFLGVEMQSKDKMYQAWKESTEDNKYNANFLELFVKLEEALGETMRNNRHPDSGAVAKKSDKRAAAE
ncbi:monovalent cation:proton antiporter-2 (CPA2) family protein [Thaumasiovibrio sp. DFM-14]|uniref:monovalent cation:proton antiporter-2 (CPA2) family protein n=1 Tax=Thaumasiovibrio sp. DFM-14 TaxID=3384792 RepID=UPI0039A112AA